MLPEPKIVARCPLNSLKWSKLPVFRERHTTSFDWGAKVQNGLKVRGKVFLESVLDCFRWLWVVCHRIFGCSMQFGRDKGNRISPLVPNLCLKSVLNWHTWGAHVVWLLDSNSQLTVGIKHWGCYLLRVEHEGPNLHFSCVLSYLVNNIHRMLLNVIFLVVFFHFTKLPSQYLICSH